MLLAQTSIAAQSRLNSFPIDLGGLPGSSTITSMTGSLKGPMKACPFNR